MTSHLLIMQPLFFFPILLNHFFPLCFYCGYSDQFGFLISEGLCPGGDLHLISLDSPGGPDCTALDFTAEPLTSRGMVRLLIHGGPTTLQWELCGSLRVLLGFEDLMKIFAVYSIICVCFNNKIMFLMSYY